MSPAPFNRITKLTLLLLALLPACGDSEPDRDWTSGIIITLDTTNRPALGTYGKRKGTTPNLNALARQSLVYDQARTVAPLTLPSHASMMTGLYPIRHQVRDNGLFPLSPAADTLAELAQEQGFQTGAFISAPVLSAPFGLNQGFDTYDEPPNYEFRNARDTAGAAIAWLDKLDRSRPFLLWVHFFDPHAPYTPDPQYLQQIAKDGQAMFAEYIAEIAQMDSSIGTLVQHLRETGLLDQSLLAVVADHGESLGRNGEFTHSFLTYDSVIRVPMFLRYPDGYRAGKRSAEIVSVVDLFATFCNGLGLRGAENLDGENLFKNNASAGRGVYFESYVGYLNCGWSPLTGWADARGTYIHGKEPEYYAAEDERQLRNIIATSEQQAKQSRSRIGRLADRPTLPQTEAAVDDDMRARLQALGYVTQADPKDDAPHPLANTNLPSPQRHIQEVGPYLKATELVREGKTDEAISVLQKSLLEMPNNVMTTVMLGGMFQRQERYQEALPPLRKAVELRPENRNAVGLLAQVLEDLKLHKEALEFYLSGYHRWDDDPRFGHGAVRMMEILGHTEDAARLRRKLEG